MNKPPTAGDLAEACVTRRSCVRRLAQYSDEVSVVGPLHVRTSARHFITILFLFLWPESNIYAMWQTHTVIV